MKKWIALLLAVTLLLSLTGCKHTANTLQELQKDGTLVVAAGNDCYPYVFQDADGTFRGIEIDLLSVLCDELDVDLEVHLVEQEEILPGVEEGKYHLGAGGLWTEMQTGNKVRFTSPYGKVKQTMLVRTDSGLSHISELAREPIAVQAGSSAENYLLCNGYEVQPHDRYAHAQDSLLRGHVRGFLVEEMIGQQLVRAHVAETGAQEFMQLPSPVATLQYGFALPEMAADLQNHMNVTISEIIASGLMHVIYEGYGLTYTSPTA